MAKTKSSDKLNNAPKKRNKSIESEFGRRLREAFNSPTNADIARQLEVSDSAVTIYMKGRIPSAKKLSQISALTNCNLHWLLTGEGEKYLQPMKKKTIDEILQEKIKTTIFKELLRPIIIPIIQEEMSKMKN